jgi:hypothetical protein
MKVIFAEPEKSVKEFLLRNQRIRARSATRRVHGMNDPVCACAKVVELMSSFGGLYSSNFQYEVTIFAE